MKALLLALTLCFVAAPKADANNWTQDLANFYANNYDHARCDGWFRVHCKPNPVACFNGSASQTSPFQCWSFKSLTNYAYYYYNCYYWTAYDAYNGYYGSYWFRCTSRVKSWLYTKMTNRWRQD